MSPLRISILVGLVLLSGGALFPAQAETLSTFAADCTTPKSAFHVGDTVCGKIDTTGGGNRKITWFDPCTNSRQTSGVLNGTNVTDTFTIPNSDVTGNCDNRGNWSVLDINTGTNSTAASAAFPVNDPSNP